MNTACLLLGAYCSSPCVQARRHAITLQRQRIRHTAQHRKYHTRNSTSVLRHATTYRQCTAMYLPSSHEARELKAFEDVWSISSRRAGRPKARQKPPPTHLISVLAAAHSAPSSDSVPFRMHLQRRCTTIPTSSSLALPSGLQSAPDHGSCECCLYRDRLRVSRARGVSRY